MEDRHMSSITSGKGRRITRVALEECRQMAQAALECIRRITVKMYR